MASAIDCAARLSVSDDVIAAIDDDGELTRLTALALYEVDKTALYWRSNPSEQCGLVFGVLGNVGRWMFSQRRMFMRKLADLFKTDDGKHHIAWPDAMIYMRPEHVFRALLLTLCEIRDASRRASQEGGAE